MRESVKIIEKKHHLAKLILDKVEVKEDYNEKVKREIKFS